MAFLFTKTIKDAVRHRNIFQAAHDRVSGEERGKNARPELPNLSIHGITPNGTYFLPILYIKKD